MTIFYLLKVWILIFTSSILIAFYLYISDTIKIEPIVVKNAAKIRKTVDFVLGNLVSQGMFIFSF